MDEVNIEQALCEYLERYHLGEMEPASSKKLEAIFHVKGSELRRIINNLRSQSQPICSNATGYFYASKQEELNATIAQLTSRIRHIARASEGLKKCTNFGPEQLSFEEED